MGKKAAKKKAKKKVSKRSKAMDQKYVAKAEVDSAAKKWLKSAIKANQEAEAKVAKDFEALVKKQFGPKFWTRLVNTAKRRQMQPRQYANAILVKPTGTK